jgi:hypothetical protein
MRALSSRDPRHVLPHNKELQIQCSATQSASFINEPEQLLEVVLGATSLTDRARTPRLRRARLLKYRVSRKATIAEIVAWPNPSVRSDK